jgi:PAS domain S-box-containing protein
MSTMVCWYWILKLQARFLSGDYGIALACAERAKALIWSSAGHIQLLDYHYFSALTIAAVYDGSGPDAQPTLKDALLRHRDQLKNWTEKTGSATFADKYALVLAEQARIEGRAFEAARLYEDAIRAAEDNGFGQNEAIANELAASFWIRNGFDRVGEPYLRAARSCYRRWGAHGKVRQLDLAHPRLAQAPGATEMTTVATPLAQLDLAAVLEALQAVSREMVLEALVRKLLTIVLAHAGAERGLLLLPSSEGFSVEAEAITSREGVDVRLRRTPVSPDDLPEAVLRHVRQTREGAIIDDASVDTAFAMDTYVQRKRSKSILCLPVAHQAQLVGVLYLENSLTPGAFTPARVAMLNVLASQAAISLQNARLYAELTEERARLRAVIQQVPAGLIIAEAPSGRLVIANDQVEPVLHNRFWPSESIDDYGVYVGFRPDGHLYEAGEWPLARSLRQGETVQNEEVQMQRADGSLGWVSLTSTPVRDAQGKITAGVVILQDIEERKRKERALLRSEARFATAFHNSPAPMAVVRPRDGRFIDVNQSFLHVFQLERAEVVGRAASEVGSTYLELLKRLEQGGSPAGPLTNEEIVMATKSGAARTLLVSNESIEIEDELCWLIAFTDLTDRKRVEEQLQQAQKLEALGSLAGGVAHDFNNQLTVINGCSELALQNLAPADPNRDLITAVLDAGGRAVSLTRKLLAFSRKEVIAPRVWQLNSIVTDMQSMLRRLIEEDVDLITQLSPGAGAINADRGQVEQIIVNLAVNARDAMPDGGELTLATAAVTLDACSRDLVLEPLPGRYVMLAVKDTGTGMTPEVRRKIFEPFFTTKPVGKGTGLGLAVVYGIVKQAGANLSVSTEAGKGTAIRVYFPEVNPATEVHELEGRRSPQRSFGGKETILVVEDEDALRQFTARALEAQGYRVILASNGREALALLDQLAGGVDLIVTDVVMPEMGGRDLGAQIRRRSREVPIVFISGYSKDFEFREDPSAAGSGSV